MNKYKKKKYSITEPDIIARKYEDIDLIEPLWDNVSIYDGLEKYESDLKPFTKEQRLIFAVL